MSGRGRSAKPANTPVSTVGSSGQEPILQAITALKEELLAKIDEKMEVQTADIISQMDQLREEWRSGMDNVNGRADALEQQFLQLEEATSEHSTIISTLEREVTEMKKDIVKLKARNEDLENRSRRCNLRIIGVKEGREDVKGALNYVSQMLGETLELEKAPLLDRAHRALRNVEQGEEASSPRTFILRCHYFQEKKAILDKVGGKLLRTTDGDDIRIFPDYSYEVSKRRAKFNDVKKMLRDAKIDKLRFGVMYPAELKITLPDGTVEKFIDPRKAKVYVVENIINAPAYNA